MSAPAGGSTSACGETVLLPRHALLGPPHSRGEVSRSTRAEVRGLRCVPSMLDNWRVKVRCAQINR